METVRVKNQVHRPIKKAQKEGAEQEKVTMFFKIGKCTMPFCRMTKLECECLRENIERFMKRKKMDLCGTFFYAR